MNEQPLFFDCAGDRLIGILHDVDVVGDAAGVLLVVGGPQYRVGSHRQFVLLARDLAAAGIPVFRFDYRSMGDSEGSGRDFETIGEDIRAALEVFFARVPTMRGVVLWGLCDAATANAFYAPTDPRVIGQIALNPWARTSEGEAQAFIRHYYLKRLLSPAFWRKVLGLKFKAAVAIRDFLAKFRQGRQAGNAGSPDAPLSLPQRLHKAQLAFAGPTLLILSGQDLTAREYEERVSELTAWRRWMASPAVEVCRLDAADHTFSRAAWRDQVANWSRDWVMKRPL